jgi:hypothetical protein
MEKIYFVSTFGRDGADGGSPPSRYVRGGTANAWSLTGARPMVTDATRELGA